MRHSLRRVAISVWRRVAALRGPTPSANARRLRERGEDVASCTIREATAADIPALAALHVATWNATYAPFLMTGPSIEVREQQWRRSFASRDRGWFCFIVENAAGELVGFATGRCSDNPAFEGELNKIYLLRDYQRLGLGRKLVGRVARRFLEQGITSMWLFGDARNPSSSAWRALGAHKTDEDPGNGNYGWRDLRALAERRPAD